MVEPLNDLPDFMQTILRPDRDVNKVQVQASICRGAGEMSQGTGSSTSCIDSGKQRQDSLTYNAI